MGANKILEICKARAWMASRRLETCKRCMGTNWHAPRANAGKIADQKEDGLAGLAVMNCRHEQGRTDVAEDALPVAECERRIGTAQKGQVNALWRISALRASRAHVTREFVLAIAR